MILVYNNLNCKIDVNNVLYVHTSDNYIIMKNNKYRK